MRAHNNQNNGYKGMLWMIIPCLLLVGVLLLGGERVSSSGYLWPILIGVFVIAHIIIMFKGHGGRADAGAEDNTGMTAPAKESEAKKDEHTHGGCCH